MLSETRETYKNHLCKRIKKESIKNHQSLLENGCLDGMFVTTVFLLDTSASMTGTGLEQMKTAFKNIIHEFSQHSSITENVTVMTFGQDVKVIQYYSCDHAEVTKCVDYLECQGNSPLEAGLLFSLSGINTVPYTALGSLNVRTRLVIITDGKHTDIGAQHDEEIFEALSFNKTGTEVIDLVKEMGKWNPIFCIPVGDDPDICFLGTMILGSEGGKLVPYYEARQLGRYSVNINTASNVLQQLPLEDLLSPGDIKMEVSKIVDVSEQDLNDICEIVGKRNVYKCGRDVKDEIEKEKETEFQEKYLHMPKIGTRVRRGQDWKWKNQDGQGPGTVVGHSKRIGWINVEWDNGILLPYRFGNNGFITAYDIEPCDEPRILESQPIAVGCLVRRGPDWKWNNQDGGAGNIGTVYRLKTETEIYVRWPNGNKSNYRYGYKSCYDVEICDPFDPAVIESVKRQKKGVK
ncbi:uncharacterized protein LOC128177295 [Crassostrea angulata]|uniref:uncharacterized protein LOC128177295 n=1 Tax=Magallana angulata TaxID=2784310 RepID=UPI0022B1C554|nr:uncharacterized protein LOC128177295 [Crassostrea angulata]